MLYAAFYFSRSRPRLTDYYGQWLAKMKTNKIVTGIQRFFEVFEFVYMAVVSVYVFSGTTVKRRPALSPRDEQKKKAARCTSVFS